MTGRGVSGWALVALVALAMLVGCSAANTDRKPGGTGGVGGVAGGPVGGTGGGGGISGVGSTGGGGMGGDGMGGIVDDTDGGCESIVDESPVELGPVDIIWIIDNSCSMFDEYEKVKMNINAFANDIQNAGVDHHVVAITGAAVIPVVYPTGDPAVGTALGMDPNHYRYVAAEVGSNNVMDVLLATHGQWGPFLRPDAPTHFVAVTDDDQIAPSVDAPTFKTMMEGLIGHEFIYHSIASETPACPGSSRPGLQHYALSDSTGGLKVSICIADWSQVFEPLKEAVITSAPLPCSFTIPPAPMGMDFDKNLVNFEYTPPGGAAMPWPRANQMADCGTQIGWHYDDFNAPTTINLCPAGCDAVAGGGKINIVFGCEEPPLIVVE